VRKWAATFDRVIVGGESIPKPKIMISDAEFGDADMLIGADFFLTHHIYVANKMGKMVMTYEGGTVFGVSSDGASDETGKPLDLTDRSAAPTDAEGFARRGAAAMSGRRFEEAIADFDQAIARAPAEARFLRQRAAARLANRQPLLAAADLDKALSIASDDIEAREMRAALKLGTRDPDGAREDILALDKLLPPTSGARLQLASMADAAGLQEVGLANENAWLKSHPEDAQRPTALNGRCWARAQLNRELKEALADCNAALKARPNTAAYLDSRALVKLRLGDLAGARADYDAAVQIQPHNAWSLFMRGVAKRRAGDAAGGEADRRAALAIAPDVARRAAKIGISE
jgi:tetratricopeptide (TPR) repeat protein